MGWFTLSFQPQNTIRPRHFFHLHRASRLGDDDEPTSICSVRLRWGGQKAPGKSNHFVVPDNAVTRTQWPWLKLPLLENIPTSKVWEYPEKTESFLNKYWKSFDKVCLDDQRFCFHYHERLTNSSGTFVLFKFEEEMVILQFSSLVFRLDSRNTWPHHHLSHLWLSRQAMSLQRLRYWHPAWRPHSCHAC